MVGWNKAMMFFGVCALVFGATPGHQVMAAADVVGSQRQRCAALILVAIVLAVANKQLRFIHRYIDLLGKIPSRAG